MGRRILLVDDDPWLRQMVGTMLRQGDHTLETARNGEEGLAIATKFRPELIISDIMMDTMDGWTFVRTLRSHPEFAFTPVIFLSALDSQKDRIKGFRLGADDYMTKPFNFDELNLRVERTFAAMTRVQEQAAALRAHTSTTSALTGDLGELGISALMTLFDIEKKSGILVAKSADDAGRIFFRHGEILAAFIEASEGKPARHGAEAIYSMVGWPQGTFEFSALDVDMDNNVQTPTTNLLMEAARRMDEGNES
ncbi:MAG: response regulator [Deltaproteobacteria bacterium]|nr:response regulator [Deltaproteobacteria bacterium]